jgi:hypothetical protein
MQAQSAGGAKIVEERAKDGKIQGKSAHAGAGMTDPEMASVKLSTVLGWEA